MKLYNTLTRKIETVVPIEPPQIKLYACGPTVYDYTHIGHIRKYVMDDVLIRTLRHAGFEVKFVQNITDVGHLTSDGDTGEDKLEKGAKKYGESVEDIARKFEDYFFHSMDTMGNMRPNISSRVTEHIYPQLELVKKLEAKGYAYVIPSDGVYFDTSKFKTYGDFARLDTGGLQEGSRVEKVKGKRNPTDFALWKFERPGEDREMAWNSPWHPRSFPGWHIECSAISMEHLGEQIDIHTGGIDHIPVHHTNEIAQSEAATGKAPFSKYWVHHNFLQVEGRKMSKSLGNFITIDDILEQEFSPMALRLLLLTAHYRSEMNFTWRNLEGSQKSWEKLVRKIQEYLDDKQIEKLEDKEKSVAREERLREQFFNHMENDLRTPEATAIIWEVIASDLKSIRKYRLLLEFDEVLGLGLARIQPKKEGQEKIHANVQALVDERAEARENKDWAKADEIRDVLLKMDYKVTDEEDGEQLIEKVTYD